jgi:hypothetical protein
VGLDYKFSTVIGSTMYQSHIVSHPSLCDDGSRYRDMKQQKNGKYL